VLRPDAKKINLQAASFGHLRNDPRAYSIQRFCGLSDSICVAPPSASAALIDSYGKIVLYRLCRGWSIYQFAKGYRFNGDDILLVHVAMAAMPSSNHLLELGSGTGSVSLMWLAQQESTAKVTLVEAQEASTKLCQQSACQNGISNRTSVHHGDLRDVNLMKKIGGCFDLIVANPPYLPISTGKLPQHPQKRFCYYELRGGVYDFAQAAAAQLTDQGVFCLVHQYGREQEVLSALTEAGFIIRSRTTAIARNLPKWVVLVADRSTSHQSDIEEEDIVIRDEDGEWTTEWHSICHGLDVFQKQSDVS